MNPAPDPRVAMSPFQINIAISKAVAVLDGWNLYKPNRGFYRPQSKGYCESTADAGVFSEAEAKEHVESSHGEVQMMPATASRDYFNSLDACHEMEKALTDQEWPVYLNALEDVTGSQTHAAWWECIRCAVHATAPQRSEAFLRVKGKWTGGDGE